ncbi:MAG TPA: hypothetical protein VNQ52_11040 [Microbacteriaceae bacterium]|nr:hypothetical protein [Microbacteriaceae bacterium]
MTTHEHRRYVLKPEMADEFIAWYRAAVPAIRARFGFTVEWVVFDRERLAFEWLVSHPGTQDDFRAAERDLEASQEWQEYLARIAPSLDELHASFVDVILP